MSTNNVYYRYASEYRLQQLLIDNTWTQLLESQKRLLVHNLAMVVTSAVIVAGLMP